MECLICGDNGFVDVSLGSVVPCDCVLDPIKKTVIRRFCRSDIARKVNPHRTASRILANLKAGKLFKDVAVTHVWEEGKAFLYVNYSLPHTGNDNFRFKIPVEDLTREMSIVMDVMYS